MAEPREIIPGTILSSRGWQDNYIKLWYKLIKHHVSTLRFKGVLHRYPIIIASVEFTIANYCCSIMTRAYCSANVVNDGNKWKGEAINADVVFNRYESLIFMANLAFGRKSIYKYDHKLWWLQETGALKMISICTTTITLFESNTWNESWINLYMEQFFGFR